VGHEKSRIWLKHTTLEKLPQWKITKIVATRLQILKTKMYQIRFRLGLRPRSHWGSLQCPQTL